MEYISSSFETEWTELCPTGIAVFIPGTLKLAPCFQQLLVQLPIFTIVAVLSAFRVGRLHTTHGASPPQQNDTIFGKALIISRLTVVFVLALMPVIRLISQVILSSNGASEILQRLRPIDIFAGGVQLVSFLSHFGEFLIMFIICVCNMYIQ